MKRSGSTSWPTDYYWATDPDPERFIDFLEEKTDGYFESFWGTRYLARIKRNYHYYHGEFYNEDGDLSSMEISPFGPGNQYLGTHIAQFRSILSRYIDLITQHRPPWDPQATNRDAKSLQRARLGSIVLDYYARWKHLDPVTRRVVELAALNNVAYGYTYWDAMGGEQVEEPGTIDRFVTYPGDVVYRTPTVRDVVTDLERETWEEQDWARIRVPMNRWDIISRYPHLKERIIEPTTRNRPYNWRPEKRHGAEGDMVDAWHFYHRPTYALPEGRYAFTYEDVLLEDGPWPDELPLDRVSIGERAGTILGHSIANDLQGLQEWLNGEAANILTAHNHLGEPYVYGGRAEGGFSEVQLQSGLHVLFGEDPPTPVNLLHTPRELMDMLNFLPAQMESVSGINAVARGGTDPSLRSGTMVAIIEAKAIQAVSYGEAQYYALREGMGTKTLRLLARHGGNHPRTLAIVGKHNRIYMGQFQAEQLAPIDRVIVRLSNAMAKTTAGKSQMATELIQNGLITTPQEYMQIQTTGQIEPLIESVTSELALLAEENDLLLDGQVVQASPNDNQILHVREHNALLGTVQMRRDATMSAHILGHIMEHIGLLQKPEVQLLQRSLGYEVPSFFVDLGVAALLPNVPQAQAAATARPRGGEAAPRGKPSPPGEQGSSPDGQPAATATGARVPANQMES